MTGMLEVNDLTKTFASGFIKKGAIIYAVKNVSFKHDSNQILGIIGESGSGKTTTARMIAKLVRPDSGEILLKGKNIWKIPKKEYYRQVQLLFQDPYSSFNPVYRVKHSFDNVFKELVNLTQKEQKERILEILGLVRLTDEVLNKYPHELSGGQLQRVSLTRSLLINPDLLIVDEPTSMVDASLRITVLNILFDITRNLGKALIFITHDISQAFYVCDRIALMYKGEIVEEGLTEDVIFNPQHPYSQKLVSDVPKIDKRYETTSY